MSNIPQQSPTQSIGACSRCQQESWMPFALAQPIFAVSCRHCGAVEWLGVTMEEWGSVTDGLSRG